MKPLRALDGERVLGMDVAVVGGGPAGATAARLLARAGVRTLLVERTTEPMDRPGESLAPSATPLLQQLGLYDAFCATEPLPCYGNRSCWGGGAPAAHDFIREPYGHGWHIDRRAFDAMLLDVARDAGAIMHAGASLISVRRHGCAWLLGLSNGDQVRCRFAIDAGGRAAPLARRLSVCRIHYDRLVGVTLLLAGPGRPCEDSMTFVEAMPEGWWYSAALPRDRLALAFMTDPDILAMHGLRRWDGLQVLLEAAPQTRSRLDEGIYEPLGPPRVAAAGTSILGQVAGEGWLACGDAAAAYDPLSSHGIGAALSVGARAAEAAQAWLAGDPGVLDAYAGRVRAGFGRYLALWRAYYAAETRWTDAPFWARRRTSASLAMTAAGAATHG